MDTDLIVGMASGYGWDILAPFVESLRATGSKARVILICEDQIPGVETVKPEPSVEHPFRSRHLQLVRLITDEYRYVLSVDTRDVIFQSDPMKWMEENLGEDELVVTSEGLTFRSCPGFEQRIREHFPEMYEQMLDQMILSMGVVGGRPARVRELLRATHLMCSRQPGDDDQAPMNVVVRARPEKVRVCTARDGWVSNYNQTGAGELRDGIVYQSGSNRPYVILHQWQYWGEAPGGRYAKSVHQGE